MAEKVQKATRLPADVAKEVEEYADARGITEADALRRLISSGLEQEAVEERLREIEEEVKKPLWKRLF
jgi:hypothetical protein